MGFFAAVRPSVGLVRSSSSTGRDWLRSQPQEEYKRPGWVTFMSGKGEASRPRCPPSARSGHENQGNCFVSRPIPRSHNIDAAKGERHVT